ncbi:ribonuclease J [Sinanaerobacter sp. ZZT-01]|uniref:ribonuclease J n=1 Tax=Sinanaerobacter sp. ZZT-01 TaxID=3111540 RepID=UPI002D76AE74|nr:ribonuclease J [Sinanaerobacter sp. ZZT-01]WRR93149.1 ribonuclease J [Sinanaerobacter sp. ZZT-01]
MKINNNNRGGSIKLIPLGGLNEIGKNITVLESKNDLMIIDCGLSFPDDEMYGIDIVIPDFSYLIKNREKIRGMVLTHGHEDHIGAIPYLLKEINLPIYGTRLTLGLVENKLKEHGIKGNLNVITAGDTVKLGDFKVQTIRTTHSIADAICLAIDTPAGRVFHTGDFKIDYTPLDGEPIDFHRLAEIGNKGVLLMLADSTNAERKGYTASEKTVGVTLENIFRSYNTRILIATFSSNVHRVQKIIDTALKFKRKVAISGRSMLNVVNISIELGYLKVPDGVLVDINKIKNIKDSELVIITTGSQGEPMSALARMASNDHKAVQIKKGDVVVLSSSPVPGNEKTVSNIVNKLFEKGAEVIYNDIADIHVSGHACAEELKLVHSLIKPKYFLPVHGEYRHLRQHSLIAENLGMRKDHIFILENGQVLSLRRNKVEKCKEEVPCSSVMVDGLGVGDVGNIVLRDRKLLSEAGLIIVVAGIQKGTGMVTSGPDIISRGFVYVRESEDLIDSARKVVEARLERCHSEGVRDWAALKVAVRDELRNFIYQRTKRSPVILPIFLEV